MNKKASLAKNTTFLYIRMFVILLVSLFTTRIVLKNLGIEDYGIYNVVGSIVSLFTFFQTAMSSANYRYFAYDLGQSNQESLNTSFKTASVIAIIIVILTIFFGETLGSYYIWNVLNVPEDRLYASFWTFQISLFSCCVSTLYMPYYSDVIAHEKMSFFAYLSIVEALLKIGVAFLISISPIDHLVFYAALILICNVIVLISYIIYGRLQFQECIHVFKVKLSYPLLKEMGSFSGWTLFVTIADVFVMQGINMMINSFFTPVVNAARGIAVQIQGAVDQFRGNLQTAFNPQITKQYASKSFESMYSLIYASAKYSTYVMLFLSIPLIYTIDYVLSLWLVEVPQYTAVFLKLILLSCIIDGISNPFVTAIGATGKIKRFQSVVGIIKLLILPICWIALSLGCNPVQLFVFYLGGTILVVLVRIYISSTAIKLPLIRVFKFILYPIVKVSLLSILLDSLLYYFVANTLLSFIIFCIESTICMVVVIYVFGLETRERNYIKTFIKRKICNDSKNINK